MTPGRLDKVRTQLSLCNIILAELFERGELPEFPNFLPKTEPDEKYRGFKDHDIYLLHSVIGGLGHHYFVESEHHHKVKMVMLPESVTPELLPFYIALIEHDIEKEKYYSDYEDTMVGEKKK